MPSLHVTKNLNRWFRVASGVVIKASASTSREADVMVASGSGPGSGPGPGSTPVSSEFSVTDEDAESELVADVAPFCSPQPHIQSQIRIVYRIQTLALF